ncbi:PHP domain-like protein [Mollisia scopiformis]|uniref:PHP domain-like protein n=1 Tax=Mollisia scopiformis TaxID=149040 RepID=A0A194XWR7_MOLSC|nr:PHP domain-like protein [Mollisia scopiformis]KUJ24586.1 PHP domain-like protein [Mollisia scopiformis]
MLYDLNVPWSPSQDSAQLQRTISFLSEAGYSALALNHTIKSPLPPQITNPIPTTLPFTLPPKTTLLRRCTLTISDPSLNHRLPNLASAYDILALRPTSEKAFLSACQSLTEHSIISLDMTQRFPFHFKPKPFMTAVNRGIRFEICYAQATMGDAGSRRNFISNCLGILRATSGRGLIVSSEATSVLGVRAPADVLNLLSVWGLGKDRGLEALDVNPRGVVMNEGLKRSGFRGVVDIIDGGDKPTPKEKNTPTSNGAGKKGKRKATSGSQQLSSEAPLSKRAAKKARLAAVNPEPDTSPPPPATELDTPSEIKTTTNG